MNIKLPSKVNTIIQTLQTQGFEAYVVGGCVRDSILKREPEDWDITTSAMPDQAKKLFPITFDTGIEHGTITVLMGKETFEVTTYRIDGKYEDNRHPNEVHFTRSLSEDLLRRDFTMNAMAYNEQTGLVDIFDGIEDLERKIIRCVGNPQARFEEDALRILRAVRFAAQLGFAIEENTKEAARLLAPTLKNISAERIQVELVKMLTSPHPQHLKVAYELGITKIILPEFDAMMKTTQESPHHSYTVGEHVLKATEFVPPDKVLRLTMLLHDVAKPITKSIDAEGEAHFMMHGQKGEELAKQILRRLKFDNDTLKKVCKLVRYHDYRMPAKDKNVRRAINKIGEELFPYYLEIRRADVMAQSDFMRMEKLQNIEEIKNIYEEIMERGECVSLKSLAVSGNDLIAMGVQPGKIIGETLTELLELVIEDPGKNTKEQLALYAQRRLLK